MGDRTHRFFIGTYTRAGSRGIYAAALDPVSAEISTPQLAAEAPNPTFVALSPDQKVLYAVCAGDAWLSSFRVDPATLALSATSQGKAGAGPTPCHVSVDAQGTTAVAANYHLGLAALVPLTGDGHLGTPAVVAHQGRGPHPTRQAQPHVHSAFFSPDGRFALVCDLGLDRIYTYRVDRANGRLEQGDPAFVASAPASGPRHLAFSTDGRSVYVLNELDNTLVRYSYDAKSGRLTAVQSVSVLPPGYVGEATAAEVRVHPSGRFVYASSRGPDTIAVFAVHPESGVLYPLEVAPCGGRGPRNFAISPDGLWIVCAHQDSNSVCALQIDPREGRLSLPGAPVEVSMPVCVAFLR